MAYEISLLVLLLVMDYFGDPKARPPIYQVIHSLQHVDVKVNQICLLLKQLYQGGSLLREPN